MELLTFIATHQGIPVDFDGYYGAQCVDLVNAYLRAVKSSRPVTGNAIDIAHQVLSGASWVPNQPYNYPSSGDVVVWSYSPYGHTAICILANSSHLISFDQNWSGQGYAGLVIHDYRSCLGWHHYKM